MTSLWLQKAKIKEQKKEYKLNKDLLNTLFCTVFKNSTNFISFVTLKCFPFLFIRPKQKVFKQPLKQVG